MSSSIVRGPARQPFPRRSRPFVRTLLPACAAGKASRPGGPLHRLGINLLALIFGILTGACGPAPQQDKADAKSASPQIAKGWSQNPWAPQEAGDPELAARIKQLEALGYTEGTEPMPNRSGVVTYDPERAYNGYTIVLSSHTSRATLIDMEGRVLHEWRYPTDAPWSTFQDEFRFEWEYTTQAQPREVEVGSFYRAWLYPDGSILGLMYALGLLKLDKDSNVIWRVAAPVHHDMDVTPDGTIYALSRRAGILPRYHPVEVVLDELIVLYSPDGKQMREVSLLDAIRDSDYSPQLKTARRKGEILHSNTLHVLDGRFADRIPAFKAGNVLTSFRHTDTICVIDMETEKVVWSMKGLWHMQHDPRLTDSGTITVFDNAGVAAGKPGDPGHVGSRIIEFDPLTHQVVWKFTGDNETQFYSEIVGSALRLPNGNTLINETRRGRYIEVTPDGRVVWEFINPNQSGPENQYIADLYDVLRFGPDLPLDWLPPTGDQDGPAPPPAPASASDQDSTAS